MEEDENPLLESCKFFNYGDDLTICWLPKEDWESSLLILKTDDGLAVHEFQPHTVNKTVVSKIIADITLYSKNFNEISKDQIPLQFIEEIIPIINSKYQKH